MLVEVIGIVVVLVTMIPIAFCAGQITHNEIAARWSEEDKIFDRLYDQLDELEGALEKIKDRDWFKAKYDGWRPELQVKPKEN